MKNFDHALRHSAIGHHRELLLRAICINCGKCDTGIEREDFDEESVYDSDKYYKKIDKLYEKNNFGFKKEDFYKLLDVNIPEVIHKDGKRGYMRKRMISRDSHYIFMKDHWNCQRQFPFPNKLGKDNDPEKLMTREEFDNILDKAEENYKKTGIYSISNLI
jgi:hypothetical protein